MSTSRRYLAPLLLLAPLNILCAKLLLTPQSVRIRPFGTFTSLGWPWPFYEFTHTEPRIPQYEVSLFRWHFLAADLAVLGAFIALCAALILWQMRRHHGQFQISLRGMLFVVALAAAGFAWWFNERSYAKRQATFFANSGNIFQAANKTQGPVWLKRLTGNDELLDHVSAVEYGGDRSTIEKTELLLPKVAELSAIRRVAIRHFDPTWGHLYVAAPFDELELNELLFYDELIADLGRLKKLNSIIIEHCPEIKDEHLRQFGGLRRLQHLTVPERTSPETIAFLKQRIPSVEICPPNKPSAKNFSHPTMSRAMLNLLLDRFHLRDEMSEPQPDNEPPDESAVP